MYKSNAIEKATSREEVVSIINSAAENGHAEGMEGVEFTAEMLAGCAIFDACEFEYDAESEIEAQAELLKEDGADFDMSEACEYALNLFKHV